MFKILVTGSKGQLGQSISSISQDYPDFEFNFIDREELDFSDSVAITEFFLSNKFDFCINCGAYTLVDLAENNQEISWKINATAVGDLALELEKQGSGIVHISTDYVFNGQNYRPYTENDITSPINYYGKSKLAGEKLALENNSKTLIFRTSWVWSQYANNFVKTIQNLANQKPVLSIIFDQIGTPTFAGDLAKAILETLKQKLVFKNDLPYNQIYNFSNEGVCSWYDFACAIKEILNLKVEILPILGSQYPTIAKRPFYSVLDKSKIKADYGLKIPHWRSSLEARVITFKN